MQWKNSIPWASVIAFVLLSGFSLGEDVAQPQQDSGLPNVEVVAPNDPVSIEQIFRLKVADTSQKGGFRFEGPVAWIAKSEAASKVILATSGKADTILSFAYQWEVDQNKRPELLELPYGLPRLFEMPYATTWTSQPNGATLEELPLKEHQAFKIETSEPLSNFVAGSLNQGYAIQKRENGDLWLWDLKTSAVLHILETKTNVDVVTVSGDGMRIASCGMPFEATKEGYARNTACSILRIWDLGTSNPTNAVYQRNMGYRVTALEFSDYDHRLLCAGIDEVFSPLERRSHIGVLDPKPHGWSTQFELNALCTTTCFVDETLVAAGMLDGRILLLDMNQRKIVWEHNPQQDGIHCLRMHQGRLLSGGGDGTICVWKLSEPKTK